MIGLLVSAMLALSGVPADLDAPLTPKPPTLRSEIRRGADAANECVRQYGSVLNPDPLGDCIDARHSRNIQQMGDGYLAFDVGLYYVATSKEQIYLHVLDNNGAGIDITTLRLTLDRHAGSYRRDKVTLGLTETDVVMAATTDP